MIPSFSSALRRSKTLVLWVISGAVVFVGLLLMPRGLLRRTEAASASELFWRAESGETVSAEEIERVLQQVADTDAINYPPAVALLLMYGKLPEGVPPMAYVQRLRQLETPCAKAYLGRLAWHTGQTERAWNHWKEALDCPETILFLAQAYLQERRADSACSVLRRRTQLRGKAREFGEMLNTRAGCP